MAKEGSKSKSKEGAKHTVYFRHEQDTPGTHRYKEVDEDGKDLAKDQIAIGTLYLKKKLFEGQKSPPANLIVSIRHA